MAARTGSFNVPVNRHALLDRPDEVGGDLPWRAVAHVQHSGIVLHNRVREGNGR